MNPAIPYDLRTVTVLSSLKVYSLPLNYFGVGSVAEALDRIADGLVSNDDLVIEVTSIAATPFSYSTTTPSAIEAGENGEVRIS